jgi:hypothetical protein
MGVMQRELGLADTTQPVHHLPNHLPLAHEGVLDLVQVPAHEHRRFGVVRRVDLACLWLPRDRAWRASI